ncbi:MAG: hypothetical protein JW866_07690, partial [Ignavibacteriales bacterium]|nr:hypothetical protein [Ignavibacteriales bacterium]
MRKIFITKSLLLLFFVSVENFTQTGANPSSYYTGVIGGNMRIQMYLDFHDSQVAGHYFYETQGINITLKGQQGANSTIYEY